MTSDTLPPIAMFWTGRPLDWIQKLSLHSFVHHGYAVTLFRPKGEIIEPGIEGVALAGMEEIYQPDRRVRKKAAPSFLADIFRLYLMRMTDFVWMDSDMLSIAPIPASEKYVMSWSGPDGQINNAALRLPAESHALKYLLEHVENPELIPEWLNREHRKKLETIQPERRLLAQGRMLRIVYGPRGLNYALKKTGESTFARQMDVYSPVPWWLTDVFFSPKGGVGGFITPETRVVHLFQDQIRKWHMNRPPLRGSFMYNFIRDTGFSE